MAPVAKVGGLADVVLGLSRELLKQGHCVEVVLPKYDHINYGPIERVAEVESYYDEIWHKNTLWEGMICDVPVLIIEDHSPKKFFSRGTVYGCVDDVDRFLYFSRAALQCLLNTGRKPDVLHLHDWHAAACAPLANKLGFDSAKVILTIHNIEHQGLTDRKALEKVELETTGLEDDSRPGTFNLLKGGIIYANQVVTVSPRYAQEVLTKEGGRGLDGTLRRHSHKFHGVLNGIDTTYWNPATDPLLPIGFESGSPKRKACKRALQQRMALSDEDRPIVGCVTRLVPQKGLGLIKHTLKQTIKMGGQFVLLGSSPIPEIQHEFEQLRHSLRCNPHASLCLHHREDLAHLIFAGSDMLIVPSLFEPCGLTQLIALRYGSIPIVRRTGGLADTIRDIDDDTPGNGFCFDYPDTQGVNYALNRALKTWKKQPKIWKELISNGMNADHSWKQPTQRYLQLYTAN